MQAVKLQAMPVQPEGHRFTYLQLADELRQEVASGAIPEGARLPSIRDLSERFGVAVATVQKALGVLADEGTVKAGSTRGYFAGTDVRSLLRSSDERASADLAAEVARLNGVMDDVLRRLSALESQQG